MQQKIRRPKVTNIPSEVKIMAMLDPNMPGKTNRRFIHEMVEAVHIFNTKRNEQIRKGDKDISED